MLFKSCVVFSQTEIIVMREVADCGEKLAGADDYEEVGNLLLFLTKL